MKLITLNLWGGRVTHKLGDFFKSNSADIWCFQEVFNANGDTGSIYFVSRSNEEIAAMALDIFKAVQP